MIKVEKSIKSRSESNWVVKSQRVLELIIPNKYLTNVNRRNRQL